MDATVKPTIEQYKTLQNIYDYFRAQLFKPMGIELEDVMLTFSRKKNVYGFFAPGLWQNGQEVKKAEIALNPDEFNRENIKIMSTLVHEMCHLWQAQDGTAPRRGYHNKDFAAKMEMVGLITSATGKEGGKRTGQNMTHYIQEGGAFEKAYYNKSAQFFHLPYAPVASLTGPAKIRVKRSGHRVKYVCPVCGAASWGKPDMNLICGDCMTAMIPTT